MPFLKWCTWPSRVREPSANAIKLIPESRAALARSRHDFEALAAGTSSGTAMFPKRPIIQP